MSYGAYLLLLFSYNQGLFLKSLFFIFILLWTTLYAEPNKENDYSARVFWGASSASNLDKLYTFRGLNTSPYKTNVYGVDLGYKLAENIFDLPFDFYAKGGINYFDENYHQDNFLEAVIGIKLIYKLNAFSNQFRLGFMEGWSYAGAIPWTEKQEAIKEHDNQSQFLNYLELTFDFDIGKLVRVKSMQNYFVGYLIKHRSGVHGLYNGVKNGGSNYNCIYVQRNF